MAVAVGQEAPDFSLYGKRAGDGPKFRLAEALEAGGVVLQFFPLPFTGVCQAQMDGVRDQAAEYDAAGVTVWGITGHYPQLIEAWDRDHHFGVEILADYDHEVSLAYVGIYEAPVLPLGLELTTKRGVVGVDREGIVRYVWTTEDPGVPPSDAIIAEAITKASTVPVPAHSPAPG